jgi:hypothetical protein
MRLLPRLYAVTVSIRTFRCAINLMVWGARVKDLF